MWDVEFMSGLSLVLLPAEVEPDFRSINEYRRVLKGALVLIKASKAFLVVWKQRMTL